MAGFFYKGILLQQHKEPALSRDLREFFNVDTASAQMDRPSVGLPDELTPAEIVEIARDARIIDERDGKSLVSKLKRYRGRAPKLIVADAIDDEPYISSQLNPLLKNQKLTAVGLELIRRAVGAESAYFAVYKNLSDLDVKIPKFIGDFPVKRIRGRYPAEYQASKVYESGHGVLVIGTGAILHLARAVVFNKPQSTTFVTVAGNCIGNPTNLEVSLGMTVMQVLERCGLIDDPKRIIIGGSMTGISVIDTEHTQVNHTTRAILAFREEAKDLNFNCIGCSRCVHVCPEGLNPFMLYRSVNAKRYEDFRRLDAQMCIGCGTCSYMCPAKLDLSETIRKGVKEFRGITASMRIASVAAEQHDRADFDQYMEQFLLEKGTREARRYDRKQQWDIRRRDAQSRHVTRQLELQEKRRLDAIERARLAEEKSVADEIKRVENARLAEEKRIADEARRVENARLAEIKRVENARLAEERRVEKARLAEERRVEKERLAEEKRIADEARHAEEARLAEEKRIADEARHAEEARIADEAAKVTVPETPAEPEDASASWRKNDTKPKGGAEQ